MHLHRRSRFLSGEYLFLVFITFFLPGRLRANESSCPPPKEAHDILKCLQETHPEVVPKEVAREVSTKLSNQGNAWKNPQVSFETVGGVNLGSRVFDSEMRLSQTIEFSGQREARRKKGRAMGDGFEADSLSKIEAITLEGVRDLYRLAQLKDEVEKIEESIQRFKLIKNQYQARPRLNPEQEIASGLIQLAVSEFEFKLNQALSEKRDILSDLMSTTNFSAKDIETNLPSIKAALRNPPEVAKDFKSAFILKSQSEMDFYRASLEEARAEAWPQFTVEFIAQNKIEGSLQYQSYGAGISLPLPVFQRNQGEKSLKAVEFSRANQVHHANLRKQDILLDNLLTTYNASLKNLKNTPSSESIESKHKKAEQLFSQGLIGGPLIIETHKQLLEYATTRNQEELRAIEALWRLYILKGDFLGQKL